MPRRLTRVRASALATIFLFAVIAAPALGDVAVSPSPPAPARAPEPGKAAPTASPFVCRPGRIPAPICPGQPPPTPPREPAPPQRTSGR